MTDEITNSQDVIDSRDVIARIDDLESDRESLVNDIDEAKEALNEFEAKEPAEDPETNEDAQTPEEVEEEELKTALSAAETAIEEFDQSEEGLELKALKALADEAEGYAADWSHGEALIRDSYFAEYVEDLCKDIGDVPRNIPSYIEIDWEATARNIQVDYTSVDFDGVTYWIR